jgi:hypothetical protein
MNLVNEQCLEYHLKCVSSLVEVAINDCMCSKKSLSLCGKEFVKQQRKRSGK